MPQGNNISNSQPIIQDKHLQLIKQSQNVYSREDIENCFDVKFNYVCNKLADGAMV